MIKLIVTDLDGTLLDKNHQTNPEFWLMVKSLKADGITVAVASGRQYYNIIETVAPIKDDVYILSENGSFCMYQNEAFLVTPLTKKECLEIYNTSLPIPKSYPVFCGTKAAYIEDNDPYLINQLQYFMRKLEVVDHLMDVDDEIVKITIANFEDAEKIVYPHYEPYINNYKIAIAGLTWVDVTSSIANKGNALKTLQEKLDISYDETMAFGDYLNDLEMMSAAKYSYAMKNARPEIIKAANFITEFDNNNDGVFKTIQKTLLTKKESFNHE
ncbi:MAG: HAD family hydrolase [Chitinophagaceae bacterium]|nr:MAG: HAD family hydrolase [Chitinophagaceae bacterium]